MPTPHRHQAGPSRCSSKTPDPTMGLPSPPAVLGPGRATGFLHLPLHLCYCGPDMEGSSVLLAQDLPNSAQGKGGLGPSGAASFPLPPVVLGVHRDWLSPEMGLGTWLVRPEAALWELEQVAPAGCQSLTQ